MDPVFDVKDRAGVIKGVLGSGDTDCVGPLQKYAEVLVSELKPPPEVPSVCPGECTNASCECMVWDRSCVLIDL